MIWSQPSIVEYAVKPSECIVDQSSSVLILSMNVLQLRRLSAVLTVKLTAEHVPLAWTQWGLEAAVLKACFPAHRHRRSPVSQVAAVQADRGRSAI